MDGKGKTMTAKTKRYFNLASDNLVYVNSFFASVPNKGQFISDFNFI